MEHLKLMKERLVDCVEKQISSNLEYTNAEELGEAVDMIKDLSEAIYYCTITEAMDEKSQQAQGGHYPVSHYYGDSMGEYPVMYMDVNQSGGNRNYTPMLYASNGNGQGGYNSGSSRNYTPMLYAADENAQSRGESRYAGNGMSSYMYHSPEYMYPYMNPEQEGRSPMIRRRYMDGKKMNDKQTQMKELEQYTQELASDLTDMIKDASPEEKQLLQQKISLLASKIK